MGEARINPQMVVVAREAREWLQRDLAKALGVNQATISKYEADAITMPNDYIDPLARSLSFHQSFFYQSDMIHGLGGDFLYRRKAHVPAKAKRRTEAEANILRMQVIRLLRSAEVKQSFPFPAAEPESVADAEQIARDVRATWRVPDGPIPNLTRVVENAGGIVFSLDYATDGIDGTNLRMPGEPPLLFLNCSVSGERMRASLAHEIGHAVMHYGTPTQDPESEAWAFANELLMPKRDIRSDLRNLDLQAAARLKQVWKVSMIAIVRRAYHLKQISEAKYRRLCTALSASGQRTKEFYPIPREQPVVFEGMKRFHIEDLGYGDDEMYALLFIDRLGPLDVATAEGMPKLRLVGRTLFDN